MNTIQFREYASNGKIRLDVETRDMNSKEEEKVKDLFVKFVNDVKKELGE